MTRRDLSVFGLTVVISALGTLDATLAAPQHATGIALDVNCPMVAPAGSTISCEITMRGTDPDHSVDVRDVTSNFPFPGGNETQLSQCTGLLAATDGVSGGPDTTTCFTSITLDQPCAGGHTTFAFEVSANGVDADPTQLGQGGFGGFPFRESVIVPIIAACNTPTPTGSRSPTLTDTPTPSPTNALPPTNTPTSTSTSTASATPTPTPLCLAVPRPNCRTAQRSGVVLHTTKDKFVWKWLNGSHTALAALGNPVAGDTDYALCLYDSTAGVPSLAIGAVAPAGSTCGGDFCWRPTGTKGFKYVDPSGATLGVVKVLLRAGTDGKAKIAVKMKGSNIEPPIAANPNNLLRQDPTVTVQLVNTAGQCWEASYSAPATVSTGDHFKDKF